MKLWGVDLGGTKIECAVIENEKAIVRRRLPTEADQGYEHIISQIVKLVAEVSDEIGERPSKIGFATPGVLDPETGRIKNSNTIVMNDQPMQADIERALDVPIKIANDANCFALAETLLGAGKDYPNADLVFGVIMGTGVGGGLVVHNRIVEGIHGIAGEWGHNILEENGEFCYCGKRGCVEKVISGTALESYYHKISGTKLNLKEITANYDSGADEFAAANRRTSAGILRTRHLDLNQCFRPESDRYRRRCRQHRTALHRRFRARQKIRFQPEQFENADSQTRARRQRGRIRRGSALDEFFIAKR